MSETTLLGKLRTRLAAFSNGEDATPAPAGEPAPTPAPLVTPAPAPDATVGTVEVPEEPETEEGEGEDSAAEFKAQQITNRAREVVDSLIADGTLHSSGRNIGLAVFTAAGLANEEGPSVVTFKKQSGEVLNDRVQMLIELMHHVPRHTLFSKELPVHVLNGNRAASEVKSAEEQGREQAEAFNRTQPGYQASQNGHQNGAH